MVACVSPASQNFEPSLSTLRYAQRARSIRNRVSRNSKYTLEDELAYLRTQVRSACGSPMAWGAPGCMVTPGVFSMEQGRGVWFVGFFHSMYPGISAGPELKDRT